MQMLRHGPVLGLCAAFAVPAIGAAAPLNASVAPVVPPTAPAPAAIAPKTVTASNVIFQAAPMPDQDVSAPPDSSKPDTTVSPKLLSTKTLFQGDGYSYASSEQTTLDNRRSAAPGLGVSVPISVPEK